MILVNRLIQPFKFTTRNSLLSILSIHVCSSSIRISLCCAHIIMIATCEIRNGFPDVVELIQLLY